MLPILPRDTVSVPVPGRSMRESDVTRSPSSEKVLTSEEWAARQTTGTRRVCIGSSKALCNAVLRRAGPTWRRRGWLWPRTAHASLVPNCTAPERLTSPPCVTQDAGKRDIQKSPALEERHLHRLDKGPRICPACDRCQDSPVLHRDTTFLGPEPAPQQLMPCWL